MQRPPSPPSSSSDVASTHESEPPPPSDDRPTLLRPDSSVRKVRNVIDVLPRLTVEVKHEGPYGERTFAFQGEVCRIGTHSSNDLVLRDPAVSRFHCKLTRDGSSWRLQDNGSLNGTTLDGVRIRDAELGAEGTIALGDTRLVVRAVEGTDETSVPSVQSFGSLLGSSLAMRKLFAVLEKVAASEINVLVEGESGTGKELVVAEIVQRGPRAEQPCVIVDCGAISPNLVESELFGHARGAFTGADRERVGAFETADGGTVFLDEIGELPLELQPKLLRAIEAREIRRVGETKARKVNVRVIAATNRDLEREVNRGRFREDLYFRLAVMSVRVPALRERLDDLPILIRTFLASLEATDRLDLFPPQVLAELAEHDWPGNVRELRNYVERTVVMQECQPTSKRPPGPAEGTEGVDVRIPFKRAKDAVVDAFERTYLTALLDEAGGNVSKAARAGGMDRMYLHRLIQKHGLKQGPQN
jgi:transcriptional regulator with GAF, ATPase, and Fis domain